MIERAALIGLRGLPTNRAQALMERLKRIAANPFSYHANVERMTGYKDAFRLRQGSLRAVYRIDRSTQKMMVEKIAQRAGVYK